jgi:hypothetical protein
MVWKIKGVSMVILDKNLKFVRWFNSNEEKPKLKDGEIIETDISVVFVICNGDNIIRHGHYSENDIIKYKKQGFEVFDRDSFGWIEGKTKNEQINKNGKAKLKKD